jgi:hypothetical protein
MLFALSRFASRLRAVRVRLADVNGPRGGVDKRCSVEIRAGSLPPLFVEVLDAEFESALDRAADAARRALVRALERSRPDVRLAPSYSGMRGPRG